MRVGKSKKAVCVEEAEKAVVLHYVFRRFGIKPVMILFQHFTAVVFFIDCHYIVDEYVRKCRVTRTKRHFHRIVAGKTVPEKERRFSFGNNECVVVEIDKMLTESADAVKVQFDRVRTEDRQILFRNIVFMIYRNNLFINFSYSGVKVKTN